MRTRTITALAAALLILAGSVHGGDWPQWRSPNRNGVSPEKGLAKKWPMGGPKLLWKFTDAGNGYTAPAVVGGKVYTMGCRGKDEYVICIEGGKELWSAKIGLVFAFMGNVWSRGPNSTPAVDGDSLYAVGSQGILVCLDLSKMGAEKWRIDMPVAMAAEVNPIGGGPAKFGWGYSWSPLVDGPNLIITPGGPKGLVAALDKTNGKAVWRSTKVTDQATYASPIVAEIGGVRQYIVLVQDGAVGVSAKNGDELWRFKRANPFADIACPTPVFHDGYVFLTARDGPSHLLKVTGAKGKFTVEDVYAKIDGADTALINDNGGVIAVGDYIYGAHGKGTWRCVNLKSGMKAPGWPGRTFPLGSGVYADGRLICYSEKDGEVALIDADPMKFAIISRFKLPTKSKIRPSNGMFWTHPVIADGKLYLRDQDLIFCYDLK